MANENSLFYLEEIYKEPEKIFHYQPKLLNEISDTAIVILDTNVLLVPYAATDKNIDDISGIYRELKKQNRIYEPKRVMREYFKNRAQVLSNTLNEIIQYRNNLNSGNFQVKQYILLDENEHYKKAKEYSDEIKKLMSKVRDNLNKLENDLINWNWGDKVTALYKEIFTPSNIVEVKKSHQELKKDLEFRTCYKIAPGFKDSNKPDKGIGDLIIWQTILEIAKEKESDIIFVTNEEKNDWFIIQDKKPVVPKPELVEEFRAFTNGKTIHIISFPIFLKSFKANINTIKDVENISKVESLMIPQEKRNPLTAISPGIFSITDNWIDHIIPTRNAYKWIDHIIANKNWLTVTCSQCGKKFTIILDKESSKVDCPYCGSTTVIQEN